MPMEMPAKLQTARAAVRAFVPVTAFAPAFLMGTLQSKSTRVDSNHFDNVDLRSFPTRRSSDLDAYGDACEITNGEGRGARIRSGYGLRSGFHNGNSEYRHRPRPPLNRFPW